MESTSLERIDLGEVPYEAAQADMARWVIERKEGRAGNRLFLLTHPPVITYTKRTPASQLPDASSPIPLVEVDRGGHATYHGPGQLIGYLVVNVRDLGPRGLVRRVEQALIHAVGSLGFEAVRRDTPRGSESLVGVWTPDDRKLASIGMRISGSVTSHGFALNIAPDLDVYTTFMSCALPHVRMTSLAELAEESGRPTPTEAQVRDAVAAALTTELVVVGAQP
ncbi:lipoyl(octanoyl) transferase LipB [Streptomyces ipomoeae]|uniref:lipoyl(octanoyl) transferase LipB n=1 Tax=Streptomyces ipomoeae TaxID=103232 RepID=UPI001146B4D0|nr:lipoyl(octanoyl) transferase LipB [Streptomyces ipomoeae]MDX2932693.1 lipoyl(octanoyl) transferase LipB [Streptomyces ipomoeae]TQE22933.1 lipoyl(octanoyl) transferase LipB [Streptomyces ipomoeae]